MASSVDFGCARTRDLGGADVALWNFSGSSCGPYPPRRLEVPCPSPYLLRGGGRPSLALLLSLFVITIYQLGDLSFFPEHSKVRKTTFTYRAAHGDNEKCSLLSIQQETWFGLGFFSCYSLSYAQTSQPIDAGCVQSVQT